MARQLRLQLSRAISWGSGKYDFRRGTPLIIEHPDGTPDEATYHNLLHRGYVQDPDQQLGYMNPLHIKKIADGEEVIVMRDMALGDVMMAILGVRRLAQTWPNLRITFATNSIYVPLFRDCSFLHRVLSIVDMVGRFPRVIDLRGYSERADDRYIRNRIDLFADLLQVSIDDYTFPYVVKSEERTMAMGLLKDARRPRVGVVVRASTHVRSWPYPHITRFCAMALERGWTPVLLDHQRFGMDVSGICNLTNQLSLTQLAAVIGECDLLINPDTGTKELAEAVNTPHIDIFSVIDPRLRVNHYQHSHVIWRGYDTGEKALKCCPCWGRGCDELPCLTGITPEFVMEKAETILVSVPAIAMGDDVHG